MLMRSSADMRLGRHHGRPFRRSRPARSATASLCVVPLNDAVPTTETIRKGLRVVFGIGAHLESALEAYESMQDAADAAHRRRGAVQLDIREGDVRRQIGGRMDCRSVRRSIGSEGATEPNAVWTAGTTRSTQFTHGLATSARSLLGLT